MLTVIPGLARNYKLPGGDSGSKQSLELSDLPGSSTSALSSVKPHWRSSEYFFGQPFDPLQGEALARPHLLSASKAGVGGKRNRQHAHASHIVSPLPQCL